MKETICTIIGIVGGFFTAIVGGWDFALVTLLIFMGVDSRRQWGNPNTVKQEN